jgi:hypothetical protein
MNAEKWVTMHLRLECVQVDDQHFLSRIDCPNPDTLHRLYVAKHAEGYTVYYRRDLPKAAYELLGALSPETLFTDYAAIKAILAQDRPCDELFVGKSYVFPTMTPAQFPDVVQIGTNRYAMTIDGRLVSSCESSRENAQAGEAWAFTDPAYRGRGYAQQAVAAWGHALQQQGKVPFYSHKVENLASERIAQKLGLIQYIADVGYA